MTPGRKIHKLRLDRELSQKQLAKTCGVTPGALSRIESGVHAPRASLLERLARVLSVSVDYLLDSQAAYPPLQAGFRRQALDSGEDPDELIDAQITREERRFLEALRQSDPLSRELARSIPQSDLETLRILSFVLRSQALQERIRQLLANDDAP